MIRESEVRQKLVEVVGGKLSLNQFSSWLGRTSWNMHRDSTDAARELVEEVELALAEYSNGDRSYESLRSEFVRVASHALVPMAAVSASTEVEASVSLGDPAAIVGGFVIRVRNVTATLSVQEPTGEWALVG